VLGISTNFNPELQTPQLTDKPLPYTVGWDIPEPGLTNDQLQRLRVHLKAIPTRLGQNSNKISLRALQVRATVLDQLPVEIPPTTPPSQAFDALITGPEEIEIFPCGALGTCGTTPNKTVAQIVVKNEGYNSTAQVSVAFSSLLNALVVGGNTQNLTAGQVKVLDIYGQVGTTGDPYPDFDERGVIEITLTQGAVVTRKVIPWVYRGLV